VIAGVVALRNVRRGRGDRRGALRLALYLGATRMLWLLGAHHVASAVERDLIVAHFSYAMQRVGLAYVLYLAVEPYARRLWPGMLVSWVRVLEGRFRDPLVGRDLLLGCGAGTVWACVERLQAWLPGALGGTPAIPAWSLWTFEALRGPTLALVSIVSLHTLAFNSLFVPFTLFVIFRLLLAAHPPRRGGGDARRYRALRTHRGQPRRLLRRHWPADQSLLGGAVRAGFLAVATMVTVSTLLAELPITPHPAAWYAGATLLSLAAVSAPALYGFWTSRAGRPLLLDAL
jgi:serine/threonine-protein kinase